MRPLRSAKPGPSITLSPNAATPSARRPKREAGPYATLFANRSLSSLVGAFACITVAEWAYVTALSVDAYRREGAFAVGLVGLRLFFSAGSSFLSAAIIHRYPGGKMLTRIALLRAVLVAVSTALAATGAPFALLLVLVGVDAVVAAPYRPVQSAMIPALARNPKELTASTMGISTVKTLSQAVGSVVGGLLLTVTSPDYVFGGACVLFLAAGVITRRFRRVVPSVRKAPTLGALAAMRDTIRAVRDPDVAGMLVLSGLRTFVRGMWVAIAVIASLKLLHAGSAGVGLLMLSAGIGSLVAAPISARLVTQPRLGTPAAVALVGCGVPLAFIAGVPHFGVALVMVAVWGIAMAVSDVATSSLLYRLLRSPIVPKVTGAIESAKLALEGIGAFLAPVLATTIGVRWALLVAALPLPAAVLGGWKLLHKVDDKARERAALLTLLHGIAFLSPLDMASLDSLVGRLSRRTIPEAGIEVTTQGDHGDAFYIVEEGSAKVLVDGYLISFVVAGDGFGERALLRDVPRTATVCSSEPMQLLVLSRDDFLAALIGQDDSGVQHVAALGIPTTRTEWTPQERAAVLSRVTLLSHLDAVAHEAMAAASEIEEWAENTAIVRQGDVGDRFYVLLVGVASVLIDGQKVRDLQPGDQFGEIALLHGVPRTADVVASTRVVALSLAGQDLLAGIRQRLALG